MKIICKGCGINIQSEDKNKEGYVPSSKLIETNNIYCMRCFRLQHYGENISEVKDKSIYANEVNKAIKNADLIIPIFDIIDFESSFSYDILDYLKDYRSMVVINKIDLLPKHVHPSKIANWVKDRLLEEDIVVDDIAFVSAKSKYGINGILKKIRLLAKKVLKKNNIKVVIMGISNVGKSSILNLLINEDKATVSKYSGTTIKNINNKIRYEDITISIIDTPGLIPDGRITELLEADTAIKLTPNSEILMKSYRLNKEQYFMFSNLCYFKLIEAKNYSGNEIIPIINVFTSKNIELHQTNSTKYQELLFSNFFKLMNDKEAKKYNSMEFTKKVIELNEENDIVIKGMGWFNIKKGNMLIEIISPKDVDVLTRNSIPVLYDGRIK